MFFGYLLVIDLLVKLHGAGLSLWDISQEEYQFFNFN
jgi:hypothetical protein